MIALQFDWTGLLLFSALFVTLSLGLTLALWTVRRR